MVKTPKLHMINDTMYIPEVKSSTNMSFPQVTFVNENEQLYDFVDAKEDSLVYNKVYLGSIKIFYDASAETSSYGKYTYPGETNFEQVQRRQHERFVNAFYKYSEDSQVKWAIMRAFDGIHAVYTYVEDHTNPPGFNCKLFSLYVYLEPKHATYYALHGARHLLH